ncbi:Acetylornithine aminotransferase [Azospirillaceae bacterium]
MIPVVMPTYARADVVFERGEGCYLFDAKGRRYLDFASGIAVTALGHAHPRLIQALTEQAGKLWHTSNLFRVAGQERLAHLLTEKTFADTVFFTNSGVEAWECGVKLIRKNFYEKGQPERYRIITCGGGFHGRTMAAISAAQQEKLIKGFGPLLDGFDQAPFGDIGALLAAITPETAAINIEPVQGEGGIRPAALDYLKAVRGIADEFGLLLFLDEIQSGVGRTGRLFAHEWAGIQPDVMCVAKGLGGGFPVGACLATETAAKGMFAGTHGSTFGGNPLAMAVAYAVLETILEPGFLERVEISGRLLRERLEQTISQYPKVYAEVRGAGLMLGIRCALPNTKVVDALREHSMLSVGAGDNVVRLLPPLIIENQHINEAVAVLNEVGAELSAEEGVS